MLPARAERRLSVESNCLSDSTGYKGVNSLIANESGSGNLYNEYMCHLNVICDEAILHAQQGMSKYTVHLHFTVH